MRFQSPPWGMGPGELTRNGGRNWGRLPGKGARGRKFWKRESFPGLGRGVGDTSPAGDMGHIPSEGSGATDGELQLARACLQQPL